MKILSITGQEYELEQIKYKGGNILVLSNENDTVFLISDDLYNIQKIAKIAAGVYDKTKEKPKEKTVEIIEVEEIPENKLNNKKLKSATYKPAHNPVLAERVRPRLAKTVPIGKSKKATKKKARK